MLEISLKDKDIDKIASRIAAKMKSSGKQKEQPKLITAAQAAELLHISVSRIYHIKDKLRHIKQGNKPQGRLLFFEATLVEDYMNSDKWLI